MGKQEFEKLTNLLREIESLEETISRLNEQRQSFRASDTVRGSSPSFPYSERVYQIDGAVDLAANRKVQQEIAAQRRILSELKCSCEIQLTRCLEEIAGVKDSVVRQAMRLRYIDGLSWQAVARRMGYASENTPRMIVKRYLGN